MSYCHECAEESLKYYLALKGYTPTIVSDKPNSCFTILSNGIVYTIDVYNTTVKFDSHVEKCLDMSILIQYVINVLYGD